VSQVYEGSQFPFTGGEIDKVVFDLADDQYLDVERQMASLLARD
jgi:arylsulfatase